MLKNTSIGSVFIFIFGCQCLKAKVSRPVPMGISISLWTGHLSLGSICAYPIGYGGLGLGVVLVVPRWGFPCRYVWSRILGVGGAGRAGPNGTSF